LTKEHRNVLSKVTKVNADMVAAAIRTIFAQPDAGAVAEQFERIVLTLEAEFAEVAAMLIDARDDLLAFSAFPLRHWRKLWSTNPLERLHREIKRRCDVVGVFPNDAAIDRLVTAVIVEQHDEWAVAKSCAIPSLPAAAVPLGARSSAIQKLPSSVNRAATAEGLSSLTACSKRRGRSDMLVSVLVFTACFLSLSTPPDGGPCLPDNGERR